MLFRSSFEFAGRVKNGWVRIGCKDFIKYLSALTDIRFSPAKKYVAKHDAKNQVLYVEVNGESELSRDTGEE